MSQQNTQAWQGQGSGNHVPQSQDPNTQFMEAMTLKYHKAQPGYYVDSLEVDDEDVLR